MPGNDKTEHILIEKLPQTKQIKAWLKERYGDGAKAIWRNTAENYNRFLDEIPDTGGRKNGHAGAIFGGLLVFAWYTALPDQLPIEKLQPFVNEIFFGSFTKLGKLFDLNSPFDMALIDKVFRHSGDRDRKDILKYPAGFVNVDHPYDKKRCEIQVHPMPERGVCQKARAAARVAAALQLRLFRNFTAARKADMPWYLRELLGVRLLHYG